MRKSACLHFFKKYLLAVSQGCGDREEAVPALQFVKCAKEGAFDRCSDGYMTVKCRDICFEDNIVMSELRKES